MFKRISKKISIITVALMAIQLMSLGLGIGTKGALAGAIVDTTPPVGGQLTWSTTNHPGLNTIAGPDTNGIYNLATPLMQSDVFQALDVIVTDDNAMDTADVSVYIDGSSTQNGVMHYSGSGDIWNYSGPNIPVLFAQGTHEISATFSDTATPPNTIQLKTAFITDGINPAVTQLDNKTIEKGPIVPQIKVTGTDETQVGDLWFRITSGPSSLTTGWDNIFPITSPALVSEWDLAAILANKTGNPNLLSVTSGDYVFEYYVKDAAGNQSDIKTVKYTIVDAAAPAGVTNLSAKVNDTNHVVLNWTNPAAGIYAGLKILRDGAFLVTLDKSATTFTDLTVERGQTYSYEVVAFDEAGNETGTIPVSITITVPEPVSNLVASAAISDSGEQLVSSEPKEIKSNETIDLNNKDKEKEKENKKGLPFWGILLLIILALVGGYLLYTQKPNLPARKMEPVPIKKIRAPKSTRRKL